MKLCFIFDSDCGYSTVLIKRLIMQQSSLNELHSQFTKGEINRANLEGLIYKYLFFNQEKTCLSHWKSHEYEDYVSWFYQRLKKVIDSYNDTGSSFEAFINKFILVSSKEYRVKITTQSVTEYSTWSARIPDFYVYEESPVYFYDRNEKILSKLIDKKNKRKNTKRILALILKCYYYVSEDFLDKAAEKLGIDNEEIREMMDKIRKIRQKKDDAIYLMKERVYTQYYRCIVYEKRLSYIEENTKAYSKLKLRLEKARERLENMRKRVTQIRTDATNRQVAEAIGIRKGTVDACLYKLKAKLNTLAEKSLLN